MSFLSKYFFYNIIEDSRNSGHLFVAKQLSLSEDNINKAGIWQYSKFIIRSSFQYRKRRKVQLTILIENAKDDIHHIVTQIYTCHCLRYLLECF